MTASSSSFFFLTARRQASPGAQFCTNARPIAPLSDGFDATMIAAYTDVDRQRLLVNPGIVRNRRKIDAFVTNTQCFLVVQAEFGTFDAYIWGFTGHRTLRRPGVLSWENTPDRSPESDEMAKDLKRRGFKFAGTVICYAFMQAAGMVNDHITGCIREPRTA